MLNYLEGATEFEEEIAISVKELETHKNQVEHRLKEYRTVPSVFSKYAWVANYHNYFCREFAGDPKDMRIEGRVTKIGDPKKISR